MPEDVLLAAKAAGARARTTMEVKRMVVDWFGGGEVLLVGCPIYTRPGVAQLEVGLGRKTST